MTETVEYTVRDQAAVLVVLGILTLLIGVGLPVLPLGFSLQESAILASLVFLFGLWEFVLTDTSI